jgi:hypothetical protein
MPVMEGGGGAVARPLFLIEIVIHGGPEKVIFGMDTSCEVPKSSELGSFRSTDGKKRGEGAALGKTYVRVCGYKKSETDTILNPDMSWRKISRVFILNSEI